MTVKLLTSRSRLGALHSSVVIPNLFRFIRSLRLGLSSAGNVASATIICTLVLLALGQSGILQQLELMVYDRMILRRVDEAPDPRLLIVGISDDDIQKLGQSTLSDHIVALVLEKLSVLKPKVIGLDIYRDLPQGEGITELNTQLQKPNIFVITKMGETGTGKLEVPPPPVVPAERIGFNDLVNDSDGVIRRGLLFGQLTPEKTLFSFPLQLALAYLSAKGIEPQNSENNPKEIHWGAAVFLPLEPNSGGYRNIDARGYQILLNYRSRRNVARQVSITQVLLGEIQPEWVKDKIILIGYTAVSKKDLFLTPYTLAEPSNPRMPGVLIHAHITSQILSAVLGERPLFWFWSEWIEILWIISWSLAGGILAWYARHPLVLAIGSSTMLIILFASGFYLLLASGWVPVAAPAIGLLLTSASVVTYRAYQAQQQQQMVMRLLGQNTSPEIADALWKSRERLLKDGKLPGEKRIATILFTDLKNFSTISEQMPPEILMEWLNEYLAVLTEEVRAHHGIINKFTGDGIMAVFGVPISSSNQKAIATDARNAVCCSLAFGERLKQLNQDWKQRGLPVVQMRVGIFTGSIVVGSLGSKYRMEYGIIGDSVNIASRLESVEKERQVDICRILIAKETLDYLGDDFIVEYWGNMVLKGKHKTVDVYRVIGRKLKNCKE